MTQAGDHQLAGLINSICYMNLELVAISRFQFPATFKKFIPYIQNQDEGEIGDTADIEEPDKMRAMLRIFDYFNLSL